jgi:antitoxin component YwqK of YwqJK toxin-antitoxin module
MNYDMGLLHGEVKLFYKNQKLKRHLIFDSGKKIQDNIFDERENLVDEAKFEL